MAAVYIADLCKQNRLLAALPRDERTRLLPKFKPVTLKYAAVLRQVRRSSNCTFPRLLSFLRW